jgi:hypothetical protein
MKEIEQGEERASAIAVKNDPLRDVFMAAHGALERLHKRRKSGAFVPKSAMIDAYDRRVAAGYRWNPVRSQYNEALQYLKRLRDELKLINAEIGL